jgi:glycogen debranching enzyme
LAAGDELGHSQGGNNNPYCQDNRTTWIDWDNADPSLVSFTAHVIQLRQRFLPLGTSWYTGLADAHGAHDLSWLRPNGQALGAEHWNNRMSRIIGALISAPGVGSAQSQARLLLLFNAREVDAEFTLPPGHWVAELDSSSADGRSPWQRGTATHYHLLSRSVVLLRDAQPH